MPICSHVLEAFSRNPRLWEPWKSPTPREIAQSRGAERPEQPCGPGTHTSPWDVDGMMWNCCGGFPTCADQVDQLPSLPAQIVLASRTSGEREAIFAAAIDFEIEGRNVSEKSVGALRMIEGVASVASMFDQNSCSQRTD